MEVNFEILDATVSLMLFAKDKGTERAENEI